MTRPIINMADEALRLTEKPEYRADHLEIRSLIAAAYIIDLTRTAAPQHSKKSA
jgi:hypothetical protein